MRTFVGASLALACTQTFAQAGISPPELKVPSAELATTTKGEPTDLIKKPEIKFLPGVRSSLTYSSNINRDQVGGSGWIGEVSPYFQGTIDSERTKGELYAALRTFFRTQNGSSISPDLRASGQTALMGDWLWISGLANIYTTVSSPFGAVSLDPALYNTNSSQFRQFQISPYIQGRMGTFAEYQARYSAGTASSNANVVLAKFDQRISGSVKSGPQFNRWGWEWTGEIQRRTFDGGVSQNRNSTSVSGFLLPTTELRVGASLNYDAIENFVVDGKTRGTGLGLFADWTPSNRTSISASAKRLYYGTTGKLSMSHRFGFFTGAISYDKSVTTSNDASILSVNPSTLFSAGGFSSTLNPIFNQLVSQNLLQTYGSAIGGGVLSDFIILNNSLNLTLAYASPVNSIVFSASRSKRDTNASLAQSATGGLLGFSSSFPAVITPASLSAFNTTSLALDWTHNLDSKNSFGIKVSRLGLESNSLIAAYGKSTINLIQSTYRSQITTDTSAVVGLRHTAQKGQGAAISYDETALFGTLDVRF